ncbi:SdiA-regulated domain-containing protein [Methylophaga sp. OBS3]|uniref:SdiA-regulated domain-containing protein n=1 Tax=Methylophaga sp. OBS3 TaxID=2991934 RepID=UPI00224C961D|nr:SdiA-regulated domain-containing protein [Methylophaga sp. OBS3]MCX4190803.1 SdiA-regulated domain-containing protein [Methylophaga sp. OBS3]
MLRKLFLILITLLTVVAGTIYALKLEALIWYSLNEHNAASELNLNSYQVDIDAKPIDDIDDLSGLTFNHETGTLFSVLNGQPYIVELDDSGNLLRKIAVEGVEDMEGISHVHDNLFVIIDERDQRLLWITIDSATTNIDTADAPSMSLALSGKRNKGLEGISWDEHNQRMLLVQERNPLRVMAITGLIEGTLSTNKLVIQQLHTERKSRLWLRDLSSVTHDQHARHLVFLSDESKMVVEYDLAGEAVSFLNLRRGAHGLQASIPQAEGLAIGPDDAVYIVSEPNLFYKFTRGEAQ